MAATASDTKPNLLDKQKTNSFGNLDAENMHVKNHYSSRKMTLAKDYKDTKIVSTGAYLDKSMAYQKLIVTRFRRAFAAFRHCSKHVHICRCHSETKSLPRVFERLPTEQGVACLELNLSH